MLDRHHHTFHVCRCTIMFSGSIHAKHINFLTALWPNACPFTLSRPTSKSLWRPSYSWDNQRADYINEGQRFPKYPFWNTRGQIGTWKTKLSSNTPLGGESIWKRKAFLQQHTRGNEITWKTGKSSTSLMPRPRPLTRKNSLENKIKLWGLAHSFVTHVTVCANDISLLKTL